MPRSLENAVKCVYIIVVIQIIIGASIIISTELYKMALEKYLYDIEKRMLRVQFFNTDLLGFQIIVVYAFDIGLWGTYADRTYSRHFIYLLIVVNSFCLLIIISGFGTVWSLVRSMQSLEHSAEFSLTHGIDVYYSDPEWRLLWDDIQYHKQCCGVHGYRDWEEADWVAQTYISEEGNSNGRPCDSNLLSLTPYSCCKKDTVDCFENFMPSAGNLPTLNISNINTEGCLPLFSLNLWNFVYLLMAAVSLSFILQLFLALASRTIYCKAKDDYSKMRQMVDCCTPTVTISCPRSIRCVVNTDDFEEFGSMCIEEDRCSFESSPRSARKVKFNDSCNSCCSDRNEETTYLISP